MVNKRQNTCHNAHLRDFVHLRIQIVGTVFESVYVYMFLSLCHSIDDHLFISSCSVNRYLTKEANIILIILVLPCKTLSMLPLLQKNLIS